MAAISLATLVLAGCLLTNCGINDSDNTTNLNFLAQKYEEQEIMDFKINPSTHLDIHISAGSINIKESPDKKFHLIFTKKSTNKEHLKQLNVSIDQYDSILSLKSTWKSSTYQNCSVNCDILIPSPVNQITTKISTGSIKIEGIMAQIDASNRAGSIYISQKNGPQPNINAHASSGSITVENASGEVNAKTKSGSIKITQQLSMQKPVSTQTYSGSIKIKHAGGNVKAETKSGSIYLSLQNIHGLIKTKTSSGGIHILDSNGRTVMKKHNGSVSIPANNK